MTGGSRRGYIADPMTPGVSVSDYLDTVGCQAAFIQIKFRVEIYGVGSW